MSKTRHAKWTTACAIAHLVPLTGLEPVRAFTRGILSPLRLPIPPQRQGIMLTQNAQTVVRAFLEAPPGFEPGVRALQAPALPLGYGAVLYYMQVVGTIGLEPMTLCL